MKVDLGKNCPKSKNSGKRATEELGVMAGVSRKTYEHASKVLDEAPEPVIDATRRKELSINAAYEVTKLPEEQQAEIASRIEQGEAPKVVISEVKSKFEIESNSGNERIESKPTVESNIDLFPASK